MKESTSKTVWLITAIIVIVIGFFALRQFLQKPSLPPITSYEKMGHLVALKVNVADVVQYNNPNVVQLPWGIKINVGKTRVLLVVKGDCLVATDLKAVTYKDINNTNRTVTIILPPPVGIQPRLNLEPNGTYIYAVDQNLISTIVLGNAAKTNAVNQAMALAQQKVADACKNPENIVAAKENTERILKGFFIPLEWDVTIKWK